MFSNFQNIFLRLCFRETPLIFSTKMLILSTLTYILPKCFIGELHGLKKYNLSWGAVRILGWQQSHFVFFHDCQSKFINTNNKY